MPAGESLDVWAAAGGTLVLHLAVQRCAEVVAVLREHRPSSEPVAVVAQPEQAERRRDVLDPACVDHAEGVLRRHHQHAGVLPFGFEPAGPRLLRPGQRHAGGEVVHHLVAAALHQHEAAADALQPLRAQAGFLGDLAPRGLLRVFPRFHQTGRALDHHW